jgi:hypothetical protein
MRISKYALRERYVQIPNATAQAVENKISLQALGLLVNLWSYPETWELHKTELYKRYLKNKKTSVSSAWDELVEANYIIEFKYRVGRNYKYEYIYNIEPLTEEQKNEVLKMKADELNLDMTEDFLELKNNTRKTTVVNPQLINTNKSNTHKINKTLNKPSTYNPENEIYNLHLPMGLRKELEVHRLQIPELKFDIFEFERFYNTFDWIKPDCTRYDVEYLNEWEVGGILHYIFEKEIKIKKTTYGLLKELAMTWLFYKKENAGFYDDLEENEVDKIPNLPLYDWLNKN